ncbi:MAG: Rrf2 family transcriptional regulator [Candidatus Omnitrophica bacterium]|nr:Rrf2 family transcriptional regulator [Candidatus Omnitrophota bacterium]
MKINTKTRYGLQLMLNLALWYGKGPLLLGEVAKRENISEKYLSQIIIPLKGAGFVTSLRGAKGGYLLAKAPDRITIRVLVEVLEGGFSFVNKNERTSSGLLSLTIEREVWQRLEKKVLETLSSITLQDLVVKYKQEKNVIMYNI